MTKKDYELIAYEIKNVLLGEIIHQKGGYEAIEYLIKRLGMAFGDDNPRFNYNKFLKACTG